MDPMMTDGFGTVPDGTMDDFFKDLAENAPEENQGGGPQFPKSWGMFRTALPSDGSGGAIAVVRRRDGKGDNAGKVFYSFNVGLICIGGDANFTEKEHAGRYMFDDCLIHPGEKEPQGQKISGKFTAILNVLFASGVCTQERWNKKDKDGLARATRERWAATMGTLKKVAQEKGIFPAQYDNDLARWIAGIAVAALEERSYVVLAKIGERKDKTDGTVRQNVTEREDHTPEAMAKHSVNQFESAEMPEVPTQF